MKTKVVMFIAAFFFFSQGTYAALVGKPAPDFEAIDSKGATVKLSDYKGKIVVLEWFNKGCPFVKKHYGSKNMQKVQAEITKSEVVWLGILSSAKGKEGFESGAEHELTRKSLDMHSTRSILDPEGKIGKLYSAKTTPHIFVIDKEGKVAYEGAIDDNDSSDPAVIPSSKNYVLSAVAAMKAGKAVNPSSTRPYGCGVKY